MHEQRLGRARTTSCKPSNAGRGYMGYEEFCKALDNGYFTITAPSTALTDDEQPTEG